MRSKVDRKNSLNRETGFVLQTNPLEGGVSNHLTEIQEAIALRAYQLFEDRGCVHGHDLEDWFRAESEILLPISFSIDELDGRLIVRAEVPLPTVDDLEVQVQDQRIIICDRGPICVDGPDRFILCRVYHAVELPEPIDWTTAEITFQDGILAITAPKLSGGHYEAAA
jgi:HSP20 family molecular chaperone IbpA